MAILTALLSALGRKVGDLLKVVFGWSTATLFGRMTTKKQILVTVALMLSLFWPIFVVGAFIPAAAAFIIAFAPVENFVTAEVLRVVWVALAVLSPVLVGLLVRIAAPDPKRNLFKALLSGYPLALGFALSFLITLITVPIVKLMTMARGWKEEHIYLQPKPEQYRVALKDLCEACVMAGLEPMAAPVPKPMALSTRVIQFFARGAVDSLVVSNPLMVRAKDLEMFLYPADLLVRGKPKVVARVRSMMNRTRLECHAYLVTSEPAQRLQDELARLWDHTEEAPAGTPIGVGSKIRLEQFSRELSRSELSFDEWVILDRVARRVEIHVLNVHSIFEQPVDEGAEAEQAKARVAHPTAEKEAHPVVAMPRPAHPMAMAVQAQAQQAAHVVATPVKRAQHQAAPTTVELIENAVRETKSLIASEVALAKEELKHELKRSTQAATGFGVALVFALTMISMLALTLVLALGGTWLIALATAGGCLLVAGIAGGIGYSRLPMHPLQRTRRQIDDNLKHLKEHLA